MTDVVTVTGHRPIEKTGLIGLIATLAESYRWAREVEQGCDRLQAQGRRLDGAAIRTVLDACDRRTA